MYSTCYSKRILSLSWSMIKHDFRHCTYSVLYSVILLTGKNQVMLFNFFPHCKIKLNRL
ncbi:hypothetical protein C2G38_2100556, partial [Gigaspora rosea]